MKTGIEQITEERWNQVYNHGYSREHDEEHNQNEIAKHAAALIVAGLSDVKLVDTELEDEPEYDEWGLLDQFQARLKHADTLESSGVGKEAARKMRLEVSIEQLIIAGALIAAEIDRLQTGK